MRVIRGGGWGGRLGDPPLTCAVFIRAAAAATPGVRLGCAGPERRATGVGPEGSARAGPPAAACRAPSLAIRCCETLTRPRPPPSGAWATERGDLGQGAVPGTVSGRWGRRRGVTARPGRGGGPRHVSLPPGAARCALQSTWSRPDQPPLTEGCAPAPRPEVPPRPQETPLPGGPRPVARAGSAWRPLLGNVV